MFHLEDQVFGVPSRDIKRIEDVESNLREMIKEGLAKDDQGDDARYFTVEYILAYICVMVRNGDVWDCGCKAYRQWYLLHEE